MACTGTKKAGRCRTLALVVAYGIGGTPRARATRETPRAWFHVLRFASTEFVSDIEAAWHKARYNMLVSNVNIKSVKGFLTNISYIYINY